MQELTVDFITSLDGYGAAEGWPGWWGLQSPEYLGWLAEHPMRESTVLMGATTYRQMSGFVEQIGSELDPDGDEAASFRELANASKVVFSSTLGEPLALPNTRLVRSDPVAAVRDMKRDGSTPMRTLGSLTLCRSLLAAGLVHRFRVVVFPVITGRRYRPDLRRLPGRRPRDGREPVVRRGPPAARVRPHRPVGPTRSAAERLTRNPLASTT